MKLEDLDDDFVYLLHAEGSDRFKIGHSNNPEGRCQKIRQQSPFPISLVCSYMVINAYECEQKLHKMFSHRRIHGEWFVFESKDHARGLIDEFFSVGLHARLQNKEINRSHKEVSPSFLHLAQDVYSFAKQKCADSGGSCIGIGDCYHSPTLAEKYILSCSIIESVFDYLQDIGCGKKCIEDDNSTTVTFSPKKNELSRSS
jgi:hypothetical protein